MQPASIRTLLIVITLLASILVRGQHTFLRNYTVDDGLPSSETYHVVQDSKGYIWLATNQGVSRFDGKTFRNFDIQNGLPENTVFEIYEDEIKRIWFVSYPFQLSYFLNDSIYPYKYNSQLRELAGHGLVPIKKSFRVDAEDNVYFSFINDNKLYQVNRNGKLKILNEIKNPAVALIVTQIGNQLLSSQGKNRSNESIIEINRENSKFDIKVSTVTNKEYSYGHFTSDLTEENIILYAQNEILTLISPEELHSTYRLDNRILWVSYEQDGMIWIGQELSGAKKFSINKLSIRYDDLVLEGKSVSSICVDKEGGEWFTTLESGLFYRPTAAITNYTMEDGISGNNVTTVEEYRKKIYLGTGNGFLNVLHNNHISEIANFHKKVVKIKSFSEKKLLIGTDAYLYSLRNGKLERYWNNHRLLFSPTLRRKYIFSIKDIFLIDENKILLGQMQSLTEINYRKVIYDSYLDEKIGLRIEAIAQISDSSFLLGTFNGLWEYSKRKFKYLGNSNELLKQRITDILIQGDDYQILGTKGSGLIIRKGGRIFQITQEKGLSSNSITSLLKMDDELWIATNNGLNVIKIDDLEKNLPFIRILKKQHGLISDEINEIKAVGDKIYIATNGGLTVFDKSLFKPSPFAPPVYIEKIMVDNKIINISNQVFLNHDQNFIKIYFSGIDFRDAGNLKFKYRLVGIDNYWSLTSNSEIDYSFLPSGKYRFEVMAINSEWHISEPAYLIINIKPPFWETWWFLVIIFILGVIFIYLTIKYSVQRIRKQHQLQNDIYKYRQEALIKQMDPHFVFNTLNSIQSFVMRNDSLASSQYLTKFSKLMRMILNNSQKQAVTLKEEIDSLSLYMEIESMRFTLKFTYAIEVETGIDSDLILIPAFIIQPFIENSIWHGIMSLNKKGNIYLEIRKEENYLIVIIEDNGIGRKQAEILKINQVKERRSIGLSIVESRLTLLCKKANIPKKLEFIDLLEENGDPMGTRVIINLPILN